MKLAVCFPGIGYHTDKPLLYYSRMLARQFGYECVPVPYTGFPSDVKRSKEKMEAAFYSALTQTETLLSQVDFSAYSELLFISKSIGTGIAAAYAKQKHLITHNIYFTPVEASLAMMEAPGIVFTGTKDPWVETSLVEQTCKEKGFPLTVLENANHSLETGEPLYDIKNLQQVMEQVQEYLFTLSGGKTLNGRET